jgi:hypothetical protein
MSIVPKFDCTDGATSGGLTVTDTGVEFIEFGNLSVACNIKYQTPVAVFDVVSKL